MDKLLTNQDIQEIQNEANNELYSIPNIMHFNNDYKSIARVTPQKLILIFGNSETGLIHINKRHLQSKGYYRITHGKIQNPSLFNIKTIPVIDYTNIADNIYINGKKTIKEDFVVFKGEYNKAKYCLVLYKNSRIIHTLYPTEDTYKKSKDKIAQLIMGKLKYTHNLNENIFTAIIPFLNEKEETKFTYYFRINPISKKEEVWLEIYNELQKPYITYFIGSRNISNEIKDFNKYLESILSTFEFGNVDKFMKLLGKIEKRGIENINEIIQEFNK